MTRSIFSRFFFNFAFVLNLVIILVLSLLFFSANQKIYAAATCSAVGGGCYKYSCPSSGGYFSIAGTCTISDSVCCTKIAVATGLTAEVHNCGKDAKGNEVDIVTFSWNPVKYATRYILYYRVYSSNPGVAYAWKIVPLSGNINTEYSKTETSLHLNGRAVQWFVFAANVSSSSNTNYRYTTPDKSCTNPG